MDLLVRELNMAGFDPRGVNHDAISANDFFGVMGDAERLTTQEGEAFKGARSSNRRRNAMAWMPLAKGKLWLPA